MANADWISSAVRVAIPAIVLLSLALFRKWFPASADAQNIDWDSDELCDHFQPLKWRAIGLMIAIMVAFAFGCWFLLSRTNQMIARVDDPQAIHLLPQTAIWCFFPGFGALACSWEITLQIFGIFIGCRTANQFDRWMANSTWGWGQYQGMDSRRILRWMMVGIVLPVGLFTFLALPMHANVGPNNISDCGYAFRPCTVYSLTDAVRVTEISGFRDKSGKLLNRAGLILDFKDGRRWSSAEWGDWKSTVAPAFKEFVVSKTGLPLSYATTEKDIPPLPSGQASLDHPRDKSHRRLKNHIPVQ